MVIVDSNEQAKQILERIKQKDSIVVPIFCDDKLHPVANELCFIAIYSTSLFIFPFNHPDGTKLDFGIFKDWKFDELVWTPDKKVTQHILPTWKLEDIKSVGYLSATNVPELSSFYTTIHRQILNQFQTKNNLNCSIPLTKHAESIKQYCEELWLVVYNNLQVRLSRAYFFLSDIAIPALGFIEDGGMKVRSEILVDKIGERTNQYINNDMAYSQYNLYTTTGRCSNKFGGINYAALNKKDGIREAFVSRFEKGVLVNADFESFHLRLIADMIGYQFPLDIPVHEYLGRQYFSKTEALTQDEYEESKKITFKLLYGDANNKNVPEFFKAVYSYVDMLMVLLEKNGMILSPYFKREIKKARIEDPTPQKVFNYMIQLAETELNLSAINKLRPLFEGKSSKAILYTYDSILFDYDLTDGKELLKESIKILSHDGKFPMRVYYGSDYHNLTKFEI